MTSTLQWIFSALCLLTFILPASLSAEDAEEAESTLVLKTVEGVQFLVEPDRKISNDPVTGILVPEPIDGYVSRKFRALKKEKDNQVEELENRLETLEKRIENLEAVLTRPLLHAKPEPPELP